VFDTTKTRRLNWSLDVNSSTSNPCPSAHRSVAVIFLFIISLDNFHLTDLTSIHSIQEIYNLRMMYYCTVFSPYFSGVRASKCSAA